MTKLNSKKFELITDTSKDNIFNYTKFKPLTRILNALSLTFCVGERFFCDAVRMHKDQQPKELQEEIKEFIRQEAQHSQAHRSLNFILQSTYGADVTKAENQAFQKLKDLGMTPQQQLLTTCCLEDLTAFGGWLYIKGGKYFFKHQYQSSQLWKEHAKEEVQHHFVAKDVYGNVYVKYQSEYFLHFCKTCVKLITQVAQNYKELKRIERRI